MNDVEFDIIEILEIFKIKYEDYRSHFDKFKKYKSYIAFILNYILDYSVIETSKIMHLHHTTIIHHRDKIIGLYELNIKYGYFENEMNEIESMKKTIESYIEFKRGLKNEL